MISRERKIIYHLSVDDLDRLFNETGSEKVNKRLIFVKRLCKGATVADAADDVGKSNGTASNCACRWNEG